MPNDHEDDARAKNWWGQANSVATQQRQPASEFKKEIQSIGHPQNSAPMRVPAIFQEYRIHGNGNRLIKKKKRFACFSETVPDFFANGFKNLPSPSLTQDQVAKKQQNCNCTDSLECKISKNKIPTSQTLLEEERCRK